MKTLLLTEIFPPTVGGSGRLFWELYTRQPDDRFAIATAAAPGCDEFDRSHDLQVFRLPMHIGDRGLRTWPSLKFYIGTARRVHRIMSQHGFGSLHCGRNLPEGFVGYLLNRFYGTRYSFYTHGEDIGVSLRSREMAWMTRCVMARADAAIANSYNTKRLLLDDWKYPEAKVFVIQPGMDAKRFCVAARSEAIREQLGWLGRTVLLTVGRLQPRKGHDRLIRALKRIRQDVPNILYAIVGTGPEEAPLRALVQTEGQTDAVQFLGGIGDSQMTQCYQQCDLFVLPNRDIDGDIEGFGMVLLEAQACGQAVIAGASGGTAETMDGTRTGRTVNCDSHQLLGETVLDVLRDPVELHAMRSRARTWVETRFDWCSRAKHAAEVWRTIATSGRHP